MTEKDNKFLKWGLTVFLTISGSILFFFIIYRIGDIGRYFSKIISAAEPIIIGLVLAYLFMPTRDWIEKPAGKILGKIGIQGDKNKKLARGIGITGAVIFLFIIIAVLIAILVPAVTESLFALIDAMPRYIANFTETIKNMGLKNESLATMISEGITKISQAVQSWMENQLLPFVQQYIGHITNGVYSVVRAILNFIIGIIVMVYVMSIQETLLGQSKKILYALLPARKANLIIDTLRKSNEIFGGFIIGKIIDSVIIGIIAYIGCTILRIPSSLLVAVIIGVTNVIPFFGPFVGAIPTILIVLIQSPIHALYLAIFILVLQQVDGNIIGPKILGDTTGLSSFWVLFAILVAGGLFGFAGMLLGVPVFAVIYYICQQILAYRMKCKNLSNNTGDYVKLVSIEETTHEMIYEKASKKEDSKEKESKETK